MKPLFLLSAEPRNAPRLRAFAEALDPERPVQLVADRADLPPAAEGGLILLDPAHEDAAALRASLEADLRCTVLLADGPVRVAAAGLRRAAHDLRGPLGLVKGSLDELATPDDPMRRLGMRAVARLDALARRWSALSEAFRSEPGPAPTPLALDRRVEAVVERSAARWRGRVRFRRLGEGPFRVEADGQSLDEALEELIEVAASASRGDVELATDLRGSRVVLAIEVDRAVFPGDLSELPLALLLDQPGLWLAVRNLQELAGAHLESAAGRLEAHFGRAG